MPRLISPEDVLLAGEASAYMHQFGDAALVPATAFSQQTHHDNGGGLGMGETTTYVSQINIPDYWIGPSSGVMVGNELGGAPLMAGTQIPTYPLTEAAQGSPSDKSASISADVGPLARARKSTSDREPVHSRFVEHTPLVEIKLSKELEIDTMLDWLEKDNNNAIIKGRQKTSVGTTESARQAFKRAATYLFEKTGVRITGTALYSRWQRHKALYKKVAKMAEGTGAGLGDDDGVSTFDELLERKCPGYGRMDALYCNTPLIAPLGHATTGKDGLNVSKLGRTTTSLARSRLGTYSNDDDEEEQNNSGAGEYPVEGEYVSVG
ncbi:hypothetical protein KI688_005256 [Linnemannia hyalina]|uniref:Uncharacterized protein n=1 Tax=Linnemannia hyalina TaxID=64524 RepID=A0A9P7XMQ2_9FUNG|nr:hypothetical protein KI688_005256 [Linnemannia hyalina]